MTDSRFSKRAVQLLDDLGGQGIPYCGAKRQDWGWHLPEKEGKLAKINGREFQETDTRR
jgi:hypothetical protein